MTKTTLYKSFLYWSLDPRAEIYKSAKNYKQLYWLKSLRHSTRLSIFITNIDFSMKHVYWLTSIVLYTYQAHFL